MIHDLNRRDESLTIGDKWRISVCQFSETDFKTSCLLKDTSFFLMEEEYAAFLIMCQMRCRNQKIPSTMKRHWLLHYQVACMLKFCVKGFKDDSSEAVSYFALEYRSIMPPA